MNSLPSETEKSTDSRMGHAPARFLIPGDASGEVVFSNTPLSFMMGVDASSGVVLDQQHPLIGLSLKDRIVALPCGRGSCAASGVILELLLEGNGPAALIFQKMEDILTLGVLIAKIMFAKSIPIIVLPDIETFNLLEGATFAKIENSNLTITGKKQHCTPISSNEPDKVFLSEADLKLLQGDGCSPAARMAMEVIVSFAAIQGARSLIDVSQVHIDACCYVGRTSLLVPQRLSALGGSFVVPSTCNSLNVDLQRWREMGMDPETSRIVSEIGDLYLAMGAQMSFTCAPYLLDSKPEPGDQVGWGESNAVVFANSVLGARTQKYPDYLDVMIAITGRAPCTGCHLPEGRLPKLRIQAPTVYRPDDSMYPLLGYHLGKLVGSDIPLIFGLEGLGATIPDMKAFGAGFATTSSAPMFHINGVTPEAGSLKLDVQTLESINVEIGDLRLTWKMLNTASETRVDLVSFGSPHFALEEFAELSKLCSRSKKHKDVDVIITTSRHIYQKALKEGYTDIVEAFGTRILTDTCWCMLDEPVIPKNARTIMTNSAKYAHYGPGMLKRGCHFGSMKACVDAAITGQRNLESFAPRWLFE